jgi:hypothetical protein
LSWSTLHSVRGDIETVQVRSGSPNTERALVVIIEKLQRPVGESHLPAVG